MSSVLCVKARVVDEVDTAADHITSRKRWTVWLTCKRTLTDDVIINRKTTAASCCHKIFTTSLKQNTVYIMYIIFWEDEPATSADDQFVTSQRTHLFRKSRTSVRHHRGSRTSACPSRASGSSWRLAPIGQCPCTWRHRRTVCLTACLTSTTFNLTQIAKCQLRLSMHC